VVVPPSGHSGVDRNPEREAAHEQAMKESSQGTPRTCGGRKRVGGGASSAKRGPRSGRRGKPGGPDRAPVPPPWSTAAGRMLPAGSGRSQTPLQGRHGPSPPRAPGGGFTAEARPENEKGRGGLRHHGPRGSNRSPPASGVDRCENDADWVWGKPRTFLGIRTNALGLAPPTECGDHRSKFGVTGAALGGPSRWRPSDESGGRRVFVSRTVGM
jgi:hypothetical protein